MYQADYKIKTKKAVSIFRMRLLCGFERITHYIFVYVSVKRIDF